ncbi:hypothetical protein [Planctellipticum variicoloris]|uniref:hypothetical protein n=1 Tax=Planctellipticum variicoloris TaxID=3064265 RepID=UPI003013251F|nr:hypothetical protein SH412_002018 [Planctomycetaceae bacterium SH412]
MGKKAKRQDVSPGMRVSGPYPSLDGLDTPSKLKLVLSHNIDELLEQAEEQCRPIVEALGARLSTNEEKFLTSTFLSILPQMNEAIEATGELPRHTHFLVGGERPSVDSPEYYAKTAWIEVENARQAFQDGKPREAAYCCFVAGFYFAAVQFSQYENLVKREQAAAATRSQNTAARMTRTNERKLELIAEMKRRLSLKKNARMSVKSIAQEMTEETVVDAEGNIVPRWATRPGKAISVRALEGYYAEGRTSELK